MPDIVLPQDWPGTGTPVPSRRSFWLWEALAREGDDGRTPPLEGSASCDVCVIGGGYTGLWSALEILDRAPGTDVLLVEADVCGGGASGANAGFLMPLWGRFESLLALSRDTEEARRLGEESARAVEEILSFVDLHGLDVEYRRASWLWAATSPAQRDAWLGVLDALEKAGVEPLREVSVAESRRLAGTDRHFGGIVDPGSATLQPALLARGLRGVALERGVRVHEGTPVVRLAPVRGGTRVTTPRAVVTAERVVLAVNAWAGRIEGLGRRMVTLASDTLVTEPAPRLLAESGWDGATAVTDARRRLNYYRTTPDGRLVFGKGGTGVSRTGESTLWGPPRRPAEVRRQLETVLPRLAGLPVEAAWTAPVEYTPTALPFAGRLDTAPGVVYAAGYSGDGLAASRMMARVVASLVLGVRDEWSTSALTRIPDPSFPPEPLRAVGAGAVMSALRAVEARQDAGRPVPAPVRALASLEGVVGGH
ncbi:NAD(P)/FAD-dependent oxidoreductase [Nocardiopsis dassonvillei]|uniref:NAD(P)/FAD-dependent oxidoreductase n=1 Tax=Nocardiopsis dassonvillei TaxID=2014 RepID=UPI0037004C49